MTNFILKCLVVTCCISFLMTFFYPKYQIIDKDHRVNTITGKVEQKTYLGWY